MNIDGLKGLLEPYGNDKIDKIYLKIKDMIVIGLESNLISLEKYYSPDGKDFRGFIIEHDGKYLSTDWTWTIAKSHAGRIAPEMLGEQEGDESK